MDNPARIIGIADAYCAMITDRPYRKALTKDEAMAELREKAGTQLDPDLVSEFIGCLNGGSYEDSVRQSMCPLIIVIKYYFHEKWLIS